MELTASNTVQSDGSALGEGGGAKPGRHCSVGGNLVGGDGRPRQGLQRRDKKHPGFRKNSHSQAFTTYLVTMSHRNKVSDFMTDNIHNQDQLFWISVDSSTKEND